MPHHTPGPYSASGKKQAIKWTKQEDDTLRDAVEEHGAKNWKLISSRLPGRSEVQCLHRWQKVLKPSLVKGPWTAEEDRKVVELVKKHGAKKWSLIATNLPGRIGKQCRERWHNHLNPEISKEAWKEEEDRTILESHVTLGNRWAEIAKMLPGRYVQEYHLTSLSHFNETLLTPISWLFIKTFPDVLERTMQSKTIGIHLCGGRLKNILPENKEWMREIFGTLKMDASISWVIWKVF
jgi:hypothetical protein